MSSLLLSLGKLLDFCYLLLPGLMISKRTGSIESRAKAMDVFLREKARGKAVNLLAHSMGGLDCRQLITHVKPSEYKPASLTTVCTPHRGSPFMDWCAVGFPQSI